MSKSEFVPRSNIGSSKCTTPGSLHSSRTGASTHTPDRLEDESVVSNPEHQSPRDQGGSTQPPSIADWEGTESGRILQDTIPWEVPLFKVFTLLR